MKWPEAIPLQSITTRVVIDSLVNIFLEMVNPWNYCVTGQPANMSPYERTL